MQRQEIDFETHLAAAFANPMERADRRDLSGAVLAEVARADGRRNVILALAGIGGGLVALGVAAGTGVLQGLARLADAIASQGGPPAADLALVGPLTWSLALVAATVITLLIAPGAWSES